jgi:hypothetical protein
MRAAVDEEGRVAQSRGCVVDGYNSEGQLLVPIVLAPVGIGAQRITDDSQGWPRREAREARVADIGDSPPRRESQKFY